jgi:hypothetical protein
MRTRFLPYCLKKLKSGNFILLNRWYKPLGNNSSEWIDYEQSESIFKLQREPKKFESNFITVFKDEFETTYYLYDDSCIPYNDAKSTNDYFKRLEKVMSYTIKSERR